MCRFNAVLVPSDVPLDELGRVAVRHGLGWKPLPHPPVQDGDVVDGTLVLTTASSCDCGSLLGATARPSRKGPNRKAERLRRKGWSEAKVRAWLETQAEPSRGSDAAELETWRTFIEAALAQGGVWSLGVVLRVFSGHVEEEEVELKGSESAQLAHVTPDWLGGLKDDVLYWVER